MPTAREDIDIQDNRIEIKIEFEMYCATCGNDICGNTSYRRGSVNKFDTYCEKCRDKAEEVEKERDELLDRVADLERERADE
jgi:Zn finger protein HypA/HybF involved in hydrogenase expression